MSGDESAVPATPPDPPRDDPRAASHATRELASMFDEVSPRYELINRLMTLGRDASWRRAMWAEVPEHARVVLDLCTGDGSSLPGLRRPGRIVLGMDASLAMIERAADHDHGGWAPRLACADAFRLPLRDHALDCVTVAFGVRNLRPLLDGLIEIARVLEPGGRVVILEATAPRGGAFAPFHSFYLRTLIPLIGRLSPDPAAYEYLARSIEEFGSGPELERDLARAGFELVRRRSFMLGATGLWVAVRRDSDSGPRPGALQSAALGNLPRGEMRTRDHARSIEWKGWNTVQLAISTALLASLIYAFLVFRGLADRLPLEPWQRSGMSLLLVVGIVGFAVRCVVLLLRILSPPP
jgi:demethylmenaquinone methyltransferase/2-methoxy-6-polyprenyl-1,4-benzoquinol methylase